MHFTYRLVTCYFDFWFLLTIGRHFFYMAFACGVNVYMVSVHTSSTYKENPNPNPDSHDHCLLSK